MTDLSNVPPHAYDAEVALCAWLCGARRPDPFKSFPKAALLQPKDFYVAAHAEVWRWLTCNGDRPHWCREGGAAYEALMEFDLSDHDIEECAAAVRFTKWRRDGIIATSQVQLALFDGDEADLAMACSKLIDWEEARP